MNERKIKLPVWLMVTGAILASCSTGDRPVETPVGARPAESIAGPLVILGILSKVTSTTNQPNAKKEWDEVIKVNVPVGTVAIVPAMKGWAVGYGTISPDTVASQAPSATVSILTDDHNLGVGIVSVSIDDVDAVDATTNTQTATVHVYMLLKTDGGDKAWFGWVNYTLLCLGRENTRLSPAAAAAEATAASSAAAAAAGGGPAASAGVRRPDPPKH